MVIWTLPYNYSSYDREHLRCNKYSKVLNTSNSQINVWEINCQDCRDIAAFVSTTSEFNGTEDPSEDVWWDEKRARCADIARPHPARPSTPPQSHRGHSPASQPVRGGPDMSTAWPVSRPHEWHLQASYTPLRFVCFASPPRCIRLYICTIY